MLTEDVHVSPARRRRSSRANKPSAAQLRDFWGDDVDDPVDDEPIRVITPGVDPTALVESLGPLPFPGAGVAQHYFQAVYERAAGPRGGAGRRRRPPRPRSRTARSTFHKR